MLLTNNFLRKIDKLELKIKEGIRGTEFREVFLKAVDLWILELYGSASTTDERCQYILDFAASKDVTEIAHDFYKVIKPNKFLNSCKKVFNMNINNDIRTILLISLGITGLGFLLFTLNQNQSNSIEQRTPISKSYPPNYQYLILVISDSKADILNDLNVNSCPDYDLCDKLYQSTKFIWVGSKQQSLSLFGDSFAQRGSLGYGQQSEYDVYFVKIELLNYNEDGFDAEVSSIKRIDAFRKLADVGKIVAISERLSASSYQRKNLYNR